MNGERETWLWLCSKLWDDWRMPIIETKLYFDMLETIAERHGVREGGRIRDDQADRQYYLTLCSMLYDGTISAGEYATLRYLWRWIDAGKPQGKTGATGQDTSTEAERHADYAKMIERDQRGKSWRGD